MRPIQTSYQGYFFRSRLEARWAIFFDSLGIKWEYELEGFHLSNGKMYLPDFFLPGFHGDEGIYVEVKPQRSVDEKAHQLAKDSKLPVLMACGTPGPSTYTLIDSTSEQPLQDVCFCAKYLPGGVNEDEYRLFVSPGYEQPDGKIDEEYLDRSILVAIIRARSARFEHGQKGATL